MRDLHVFEALAHPVRLRLYVCVSEAEEALSREEVASATGVNRPLAAYHLDVLAKRGLLETEHRRHGRGRPVKVYRRAEREYVLRAPPRDYRLLAEILAEAVVPERAAAVARRVGRAHRATGIREELTTLGYEPAESEPGVLRLRNCPFAEAARRCTSVVCGVNLALVEGLLEGRPATARLAPHPGACCVEVRL